MKRSLLQIQNDFYRFSLIFLLLIVSPLAAAKVTEYRLNNGMKILVKEDSRAPIVISQVWYRIGSSYEYDGASGISHFLEHMMFKGTEQYPAGEFSRIIAENGGRENAFTGKDYTAYFQTLEKSRLEVSMQLEADRMRNLLLDPDEVSREREVVKEERRLRTEDSPQSYAWEVAMAAAYQTSPYRRPIIGWMQDIEAITVADLQRWYQQWYVPNNATLVVAGDVNPNTVFALAQQYFGDIPAAENSALPVLDEVRQTGNKRLTVKRPAKIPWLLMSYKVPTLSAVSRQEENDGSNNSNTTINGNSNEAVAAWEVYALDVLAGIFSSGKSARFPSRLVRKQEVATDVGAQYNMIGRLQTTTFNFSGTPAKGRDIRELELAIRREIRDLQENQVTGEELQRVKTQVASSYVYQKDSLFFQAMILGMTETVGLEWQLVEKYVENIQQVTAEQVQMVAKRYLVEDALTQMDLLPLPIASGQQVMNTLSGDRHVH